MILSFADKTTEELANGRAPRGIPMPLAKQAAKRLAYLAAATRIEDLFIPPSNRFHALQGTERYSLWVNDQWRITFTWTDAGPQDAKFEDYH